ncbi:hypothetical protein HX049_02515 [Myroides odoratimimus]|uniref:hypothetical protein n=1 Tax=Myroides odoratimimus TaxID=76832 RepID=UPI002576E6BD|nr:hypothetical protein [Myroides odoratimimus]MDM1396053.1 hypothetical protein [Myroides odoratimimus]
MEDNIENNINPVANWLQALPKTATNLLTFISLLGIGFSMGMFISNQQSKIEKLELKMEFDKELKESNTKKDELIEQLKEELREFKMDYKILKNKDA